MSEAFEEWLTTIEESNRARASALRDQIARLGAEDAEDLVKSEIAENIAQYARFLALHRLWPDDIDAWSHPNAIESIPAACRLVAKGADRRDLVLFARAVAYESVFWVINRIDEGRDPDASEDAPGWRLMETDAEGELTGRDVGGLHEDLLSMDPSGREGRDLSQ